MIVDAPNEALLDERLSWRATGILCYLQALPEGEGPDMEELRAAHTEGRGAVRTALKELEDAGYLTRRPARNPLNGLMDGWSWVVNPSPAEVPDGS